MSVLIQCISSHNLFQNTKFALVLQPQSTINTTFQSRKPMNSSALIQQLKSMQVDAPHFTDSTWFSQELTQDQKLSMAATPHQVNFNAILSNLTMVQANNAFVKDELKSIRQSLLELKAMRDDYVKEVEKMEVEKDSVHTEELDAAVASKVNPSDESSKNIDFDEEVADSSVKVMLFQNNGEDMINGVGKDDDVIGNCGFLANSDLGEISGDVSEEHEGGKDVEVEKESLEVERNHLDTEHFDVLGNFVVEVTPETCFAQGTGKNLDFDESNAEIVKEVLAYADDHGETLCDMSEESKSGDSLQVEEEMTEVEDKIWLVEDELHDDKQRKSHGLSHERDNWVCINFKATDSALGRHTITFLSILRCWKIKKKEQSRSLKYWFMGTGCRWKIFLAISCQPGAHK